MTARIIDGRADAADLRLARDSKTFRNGVSGLPGPAATMVA
jgi:hypothetical protein